MQKNELTDMARQTIKRLLGRVEKINVKWRAGVSTCQHVYRNEALIEAGGKQSYALDDHSSLGRVGEDYQCQSAHSFD